MATETPEIQIWSVECGTLADRDKFVERIEKIEGCNLLFRGTSSEGNPIAIISLMDKATRTHAAEVFGPISPNGLNNVDHVITFRLVPKVETEISLI